jgi:two-component system cell cycle response regulator
MSSRTKASETVRILIAEDELVNRMILVRTLEGWGYEVEQVVDGDTALERLTQDEAPTLAIIDWMMPGMDGPDVCKAVRESGPELYRYLILLTARTETEDLVHGLSSGADDFLSKPFVREELRARLRTGQRILALQNELIDAREALRYQATRDALTGVLNRGTLMQRMQEELQRIERTGGAVGVALFDLDHFKDVNDTFGHLAGDEVLRQVTQRVAKELRQYDSLGRYGGEEFIALFPGIDEVGLMHASERLRAAICAEPVQFDKTLIPISASVGVSIRYHETSTEDVLAEADAALYRAKEQGRNRVEFAYDTLIPMRRAS